jgi:sulfur-oxidizing protein SoxX
MKSALLIVLGALGVVTASCDRGIKSTRSFTFPTGDAARGQAAFVALKCTACHTVVGVTLPKTTAPADQTLALGGQVAHLRTYGDLLTAIVHPNAGLSDKLPMAQWRKMEKTPMRPVNDVMTVQQMIDLVTFLQPRYTPLEPLIESHFSP